MKRIFIFVVVLLTGALVRAQTPQFPSDPVTHEVTYTEEVRVPGKSGREIYDKAKPFVYEDLEKVKFVRFWGDENTLSIHVHGAFPYDYGGRIIPYPCMYTSTLRWNVTRGPINILLAISPMISWTNLSGRLTRRPLT